MSFGAVAGAVVGSVAAAGVGAALSSGSGGSSGSASNAANAADPFASQRGQYQTMLSALINNPSSITSTPGYQFELQAGQDAVNGNAAATGFLNSGNRGTALQQNAEGFASSQLNNQELLLAQLSGANTGSPGTAGQILQGQNQLNQQASGAVANQIGGAVTSGFNNAFSGSGSSGSGFNASTFTPGGGSGFGVGNNTFAFNSGVSDPSFGVSGGTFGA